MGCDSAITTILSIKPNSSSTINASFCANSYYTLPNGQTTNVAANYTTTIPNYLGCDSVITTHLTNRLLSYNSVTASICANQTYTLPKGKVVNIAGNYTDTLTNYVGCDSVVFTQLSVHPVSSQTIHKTICSNETYMLPNGTKTNVGGIYNYSFKTANYNCDSLITVNLTVADLPQVNLGNDTTLCLGNAIILNATNTQGTYQWNDWSNQPIKTVNTSGLYSVLITNPPCPVAFDSIRINYVDCEHCGIAIPSAFTPNDDGHNDKFKVETNCLIAKFHLVIHNRWGQTVFETTDLNTAWDGTFNGSPQPVSVFIYQAEATKANGEVKTFTGNVSLIR